MEDALEELTKIKSVKLLPPQKRENFVLMLQVPYVLLFARMHLKLLHHIHQNLQKQPLVMHLEPS